MAAEQHADPARSADFRQRQVAARATLVVPALGLWQAAGLVKLGPGAWEGSRIKAHAATHTALSYGRRAAAAQKLADEGQELLGHAAAVEHAAEARSGQGQRGAE